MRAPGTALVTALATTLVMATLLAGCESAGPANAPAGHRKTGFRYGNGDGQTMATAVEIRTRSETEGEALLRDWIRAAYPGFTIQQQELIEQRERAYNRVTIVGPYSTAHRLFFDVSSYYRRDGGDSFPRPLP